jgi:hypothetical protein
MTDTDTMTVEQIVAELRDMLTVTRDSPTLAQRLTGKDLTVLYEFIGTAEEAADSEDGAGNIHPHVMYVGTAERGVRAGAVPYDEVDIVIRALPLTLHRLTSGELNGREAIVSGMLDIRKAPSLPRLLLMRGLFNQYKKLRARNPVSTSIGSDEPDENCAVETATPVPQDRP